MSTFTAFKRMFKGVSLDVEDLYLLESFQIGYLPGWAPEREFAALLWAYPSIKRFLLAKNPALADYVARILAQFEPVGNPQELAACADTLLWTIADLLVYNKCPEAYDSQAFHEWDFAELTTITPLAGKTVVDGGAGTGRVTLEAAQTARHVFAIEPVTRLRQFIRDKAAAAGLDNVFVIDGFNHRIPLPRHFADVLVTSHALGWNLEEELKEFERVVKPGGFIIHCPGTAEVTHEEPLHSRLVSPDWGYAFARYREADGWKRKYWKRREAVS